jgi:hypothetical protein
MRYIFKVLLLGRNPEVIHFYASSAFGEPGEDKGTYFEWYKEIKSFENICDLEIDAITDISADLDEIIPIVDGIIYFINPLNKDEIELLGMVLPDIFNVKRDIPTIINFYDQDWIIPLNVNDLLSEVWVNYPSLEAFVNLSPREFHQALQSLSLAMVNGEEPLNIENAWMRFPILIQMANIYFEQQNYYYAAQSVRKAALIAEIYNREEFFIISEKAANLYSKINLFLEASKILENIDKIKSVNLKILYAEAMIRDANLAFNRGEYESAANQYEKAGQWASLEFLDKNVINSTFRMAISSWISACKVENAFRILDNLSHEEIQFIMKEISLKIGASADFLVKTKKFEHARDQLYIAINKYQREALSEELKELTTKLTDILIKIFKHKVNSNEIYAAKYTYDEIENMWESYNVKRTDLDSILKRLVHAFLERNNFGMATILINKMNSLILKQELTEKSSELEDAYNASIKKEIADRLSEGVGILTEYVEAELDIIVEMNKKKTLEAEALFQQDKHLKAAYHLLDQAEYLKKLGKEEIRDKILTKSLDILLEGNIFKEFFITFNHLSLDMRKKYLTRIFSLYLDKLKEIEKIKNFETIERIMEDSNRVYRNYLLYDESKQISLVNITIIKHEALNLLQTEENLSGIGKANDLVKKARNISNSYLEKEESLQINYDKIFKKIAEIYIKLDDLPNAHAYNDRIENKEYKKEIHKKIDEIEAEESAIRSQRAIEVREERELEEISFMILDKAREYRRLDYEKEFRERNARKRRYFQEALDHIANQEYTEAIILYKESINRLNRINKYNLAGVSLAVLTLLMLKENRILDVKQVLDDIIHNLSGLGQLFSETFPVTLVKYIIQANKYQDDPKLNEGLSLMEHLPLFDEELKILYDSISEDYRKVEEPEISDEKIEETDTTKEI